MSKLLLFAAFVASSYAAPFVNSVRPRGVGDPVTSLPPKLDYTQYPEIDQAIFITGKYLTAPIVQDAMAIVKKVVPQELLNIPVSTYILYGDVTYHSDPDKYCYWPNSLCVRKTGGNGYIADAYTCSGTKRWGLTYDDGPTSNIVNGIHVSDTSEIRSNLKSLGVKATFFMTGTNIRINPDEAKKNVDEGHQIALHTWTHHPLTTCTNEQIVAEIKYTEAALYEATGKITTYLRPPYGDVDDRVRAIANALGYRIALWDRESTDTATDDADSVLNVIKGWFDRPESFVSLEHDITPFTSSIAVRALKAIADYKNSHGGVFPLQISDMASCNGHQPYAYDSSKLKDWDF
ncbi:chitin deacetylase, partial [Nowakowskiella sp. JEL0407]